MIIIILIYLDYDVKKVWKIPILTVVVHGGPGAPGEMRPGVKELSKVFGVLERLQSADSINGQREELKTQIESNTSLPVTLIGFSWGAWLSYLLTTKYPKLIKSLFY